MLPQWEKLNSEHFATTIQGGDSEPSIVKDVIVSNETASISSSVKDIQLAVGVAVGCLLFLGTILSCIFNIQLWFHIGKNHKRVSRLPESDYVKTV